jgi:hypothetical protein
MMEYGRRTSWTGRPRPRLRVRSPLEFARLLQPGARLTAGSNFDPLPTTPASSWRHILERSSRGISDISNRFWAKNRTCRKQTIKPRLTGARTAIKLFEIRQISAQNLAALNPQIRERFVNFRPFLPGSALQVECDVTHSKKTTAPFLHGATTSHSRLTVQLSSSRSDTVLLAQILRSSELIGGNSQ